MTSEFLAAVSLTAAYLPLAATDAAGLTETLLGAVLMGVRVALGIGLVVFVHELGHFLAAKMFGVKVEKFYVGFDVPISIGPLKFPRTLGKFSYGETEYGIGVIPLGGYVKMLGQDDDPRKAEEEAKRIRLSGGDEDTSPKLDPRSYPAKPVWQRMVIISAGVVMNVITGILFAAIAFGYGVNYNPAVIGGVIGGGPAWEAGVEPGGQVVSVGEFKRDEQMHFREMQFEIVTAAMDEPNEPIDVAIRYDDSLRQYQLASMATPDGDRRFIGILSPSSAKIHPAMVAAPLSAASEVLTDADAGAEIVSFDGNAINPQAIVPATALIDYIYKHPTKTIELKLRRVDSSEHTVQLVPQKSKSIGTRWAVGPITAMVKDGPAMKAGLQVGDTITAVGENSDLDAYSLAIDLVGRDSPVQLSVLRGNGKDAKKIDAVLEPSAMLQTLAPNQSSNSALAINVLGLAYSVLPTLAADIAYGTQPTAKSENASKPESIAEPIPADQQSAGDQLSAGDIVQKLTANWPMGKVPAALSDEMYLDIVTKLTEGWEIDGTSSVTDLVEVFQVLPEGTQLDVLAIRGTSGRVVQSTLTVHLSDSVWFDRGLILAPSEAVQTADSFSEALSLGLRRGMWDLSLVFRSLKMIGRGNVGAKDIGGPIRIVKLAWQEANRGLSAQLLFLTMLSMNLAILNFLPIPALDGGHMMFLIAEAVRGRRVDEELEMRLTLAGVVALLLLMAFVLFNDIYQG